MYSIGGIGFACSDRRKIANCVANGSSLRLVWGGKANLTQAGCENNQATTVLRDAIGDGVN